MDRSEILGRIKARLDVAYGNRLRGIVLYGSEAREDAQSDSDVDVLVLLEGPVDYRKDLKTNLDVLYPLALEIDRRISAKPVDAQEYETIECPLYREAHREGMLV